MLTSISVQWVDEDEQDAAPEDDPAAGMGGMPDMGAMGGMGGMGGGDGGFGGIGEPTPRQFILS